MNDQSISWQSHHYTRLYAKPDKDDICKHMNMQVPGPAYLEKARAEDG